MITYKIQLWYVTWQQRRRHIDIIQDVIVLKDSCCESEIVTIHVIHAA